jgi:two-component system sensor histidine kinase UhpB
MTWQDRLGSMPILIKVLVANTAVVLIGAVVGTYTTAHLVRDDVVPMREWLVLLFAVLGVLLSVGVNYWVLKIALEPLDSLEQVATAVREGDFSARTEPWRFGDPQLVHFSDTFNQTLDELQRDREQIRELADQVIRAQEVERQRISRELHDDTAQVLFAQLLRLTALKGSENPEVRATAGALEEMTVEAIESVRRLALELRPPALDDLGLREALGELAQRFEDQTGIPVTFRVEGPRQRLGADVELALYRVAQEALTNVGKHARASQVNVTLCRKASQASLTVDDDGVGLDRAEQGRAGVEGSGLGLFGMIERVQLVGGTLSIEPRWPRGTRVQACVPIAIDDAPDPALPAPDENQEPS